MMPRLPKRLSRTLAAFLIAALLAPTVPLPAPPRAEAALAVTEVGPALGGVLTTAAAQLTERFKEDVLDPMAVLLARAAIRVLTASIVNWINSGFKGNPTFVSDLGGFLGEVADQAIGEFIYGTELAFLCSPFQLDVRISLLKTFIEPKKAACRLSDITRNIENFLNRSFTDGGWPAWYVLTTDPYGNPYSSYVNSSFALQARILTAQGEQLTLLDFGSGFLSVTECTDYDDFSESSVPNRTYGYGKKEGQDCQIVTPGRAIEGTLEQYLGTELRQLELADSFNEIINALIGQLIRQVFLGGGGLRGVSRGASVGGASFIQNFGASVNAEGLAKVKQDFADGVGKDIGTETRYRAAKEASLSAVNEAGRLLEELHACYAEKLARPDLSEDHKRIARERMAAATSTIAAKIEPSREEYRAQIESANLNIALLNDFVDRVAKVQTEFELELPAREMGALRASGRLHDLRSVSDAELQRDAVVAEMSQISADTRAKIEECKAFPGSAGGSGGS